MQLASIQFRLITKSNMNYKFVYESLLAGAGRGGRREWGVRGASLAHATWTKVNEWPDAEQAS